MHHPIPLPALLAGAALALSACSSAPVHEQERFDPQAPYQYRVPIEPERACAAARLALLSQGYTTEDPNPNQLRGRKTFQPEDESHVELEFNVVCASTRSGTTVYANAQESRYELKKSSQAAGISLPSLGSISLPWGSSSESLVKVGGHTIADPGFYKRFYDLLDAQLGIRSGR